jgi:hypothetical protein
MAFQFSVLSNVAERLPEPVDRQPMALADVLEIHMFAMETTVLPDMLSRVSGNNSDIRRESLDYLKNKLRLCFYAAAVTTTGPNKPLAYTLHKKLEDLMALGPDRDAAAEHEVWCRALHYAIILTCRPGKKDVSSTPNATLLADALLASMGKGTTTPGEPLVRTSTPSTSSSCKAQQLVKVITDNGMSQYVMRDAPAHKNTHQPMYESDEERPQHKRVKRTDFLEVNTPIVSTHVLYYFYKLQAVTLM